MRAHLHRARHPGLGPLLPQRPGRGRRPGRPPASTDTAPTAWLGAATRPPRPPPGHPPGRRLTAGPAGSAQCRRGLLVQPVQDRVDRLRASRASSIRSWPMPGKSSGAPPYRRAARSSATRGTTRSSGLPTTSTGGAPTGRLGLRLGQQLPLGPPARPDRAGRRTAGPRSSGSSRLNSCRAVEPQPAAEHRRQRAGRVAAQRRAERRPAAEDRRDQHRRPRRVAGQRVRHHQRAGAVPHQHRLPRQAGRHLDHVMGVRPQRRLRRRLAAAVPAQAHRVRREAARRGVLQPVLGERPRAVPEARARTAAAAAPASGSATAR